MAFCKYCGEKQDDDAAFCENCGKNISVPSGNTTEPSENKPAPEPKTEKYSETILSHSGGFFRYNYGADRLEFINSQTKMIDGFWEIPKDQWDKMPSKHDYCQRIVNEATVQVNKNGKNAVTSIIAVIVIIVIVIFGFKGWSHNQTKKYALQQVQEYLGVGFDMATYKHVEDYKDYCIISVTIKGGSTGYYAYRSGVEYVGGSIEVIKKELDKYY